MPGFWVALHCIHNQQMLGFLFFSFSRWFNFYSVGKRGKWATFSVALANVSCPMQFDAHPCAAAAVHDVVAVLRLHGRMNAAA